jgi:hypothetical protein
MGGVVAGVRSLRPSFSRRGSNRSLYPPLSAIVSTRSRISENALRAESYRRLKFQTHVAVTGFHQRPVHDSLRLLIRWREGCWHYRSGAIARRWCCASWPSPRAMRACRGARRSTRPKLLGYIVADGRDDNARQRTRLGAQPLRGDRSPFRVRHDGPIDAMHNRAHVCPVAVYPTISTATGLPGR